MQPAAAPPSRRRQGKVHASSCCPHFQPHCGTSAEKCQAGQQRHGGWHVTAAGSAVQEMASPIDHMPSRPAAGSRPAATLSEYNQRCIAVTATSAPQLPRPAVLLRCLRGSDLMCILDPDRVLHDRCGLSCPTTMAASNSVSSSPSGGQPRTPCGESAGAEPQTGERRLRC